MQQVNKRSSKHIQHSGHIYSSSYENISQHYVTVLQWLERRQHWGVSRNKADDMEASTTAHEKKVQQTQMTRS